MVDQLAARENSFHAMVAQANLLKVPGLSSSSRRIAAQAAAVRARDLVASELDDWTATIGQAPPRGTVMVPPKPANQHHSGTARAAATNSVLDTASHAR